MRSDRDSREVSAGSWEKFAQDDPYTYNLTSLESNDPGEFWPSGQRTVQRELPPLLVRHRIGRGVARELGCDVGRLIFPLSTQFDTRPENFVYHIKTRMPDFLTPLTSYHRYILRKAGRSSVSR